MIEQDIPTFKPVQNLKSIIRYFRTESPSQGKEKRVFEVINSGAKKLCLEKYSIRSKSSLKLNLGN